MFAKLKFGGALVALVCIAVASMMSSASAISVEVAKKCHAVTAKEFPPRVPGNPAAGSTKGDGKAQQAYYNKCVDEENKKEQDAGKPAR
jgi:hypothetical protein